jgi:hypothetical protein
MRDGSQLAFLAVATRLSVLHTAANLCKEKGSKGKKKAFANCHLSSYTGRHQPWLRSHVANPTAFDAFYAFHPSRDQPVIARKPLS